jgi:hypothetical protein
VRLPGTRRRSARASTSAGYLFHSSRLINPDEVLAACSWVKDEDLFIDIMEKDMDLAPASSHHVVLVAPRQLAGAAGVRRVVWGAGGIHE